MLRRLNQSGKRLSKGHRKIAEYIVEHYDKAAFMTANKLGKTVHVSESTVVRFASELKYDGYPAMQKALQELEDQQLIFTERTNGKFVTENVRLIARYKKQLAAAAARSYLVETKKIGASFEESINILQEIGGGR